MPLFRTKATYNDTVEKDDVLSRPISPEYVIYVRQSWFAKYVKNHIESLKGGGVNFFVKTTRF